MFKQKLTSKVTDIICEVNIDQKVLYVKVLNAIYEYIGSSLIVQTILQDFKEEYFVMKSYGRCVVNKEDYYLRNMYLQTRL